MPPIHPVVVVGFDGTPASRAAVSRGIERVREGGHLVVVQSYEVAGEDPQSPSYGEVLEDAADEAARSIDQLADDEARLAFVGWERAVVEGEPASTLCRVAAEHDADELIIGTRGLDRIGVLLGSVASAVLHLADRPVTVIPERMLAQHTRVVGQGIHHSA